MMDMYDGHVHNVETLLKLFLGVWGMAKEHPSFPFFTPSLTSTFVLNLLSHALEKPVTSGKLSFQ